MKKAQLLKQFFVFILSLSSTYIFSQNFTWIRGSNTISPTGTYGTMGVASATNDPGGRHGCGTWKDAAGNLWLFGGEGYTTNNTLCWLSDLWKYNPNTNQWTWVRGSNGQNAIGNYGTQGVPSANNDPGAREFMMTWVDASGNFWLFGGDGFGNNNTFGRLGDLWKYDPNTNMWTWMKGFTTVANNGIYGTMNVSAASNLPGSRFYGATWSDGVNKLYLFGGRGYAATGGVGYLNDMWSYDIATNDWTWIGGTNQVTQNGLYGTLGVPSATNLPGGRGYSGTWTDASGNFYLFGGLGLPAVGVPSYLNDLWKYNPNTSTWTWISGSNVTNVNGIHGTIGVPNPANVPGSRYGVASWMDLSGNLWLFGGRGWPVAPIIGILNDLWKFDPSTNLWTWMKGSNNADILGNYGVLGVPNANNMPGSRLYNDFWRDSNGKFWLFGGEGFDGSDPNNSDHLNDLWSFAAPCSFDSLVTSPVKSICAGKSITLNAYSQNTINVSWYATPTSTTSIGTGSVFTTATLSPVASPSIVTYYAQADASCTLAPRVSVQLTVNPAPAVILSSSTPTICNGNSATLIAIGANTYSWSTGSTTNVIVVSPSITTNYSVTGTNTYGCQNGANSSIIAVTASLVVSSSNSVLCLNTTASLTVSGAASYTWNTAATSSVIVISPTVNTTYTVNGIDANGCSGSKTFSQTVSPCTGLYDFANKSDDFYVFPNPANGEFIIKTLNSSEVFDLKIYNLIGQKVFELDKVSSGKSISTELPNGIYYYRIVIESNVKGSGKLIVAN